MSRPVVTFNTIESVGHIVQMLKTVTYNGFPVVDPHTGEQVQYFCISSALYECTLLHVYCCCSYVFLNFATLIALNHSIDRSGMVCCGGNANVTVRVGHQICCAIKVCSVYLCINKF